MSIEKPLLSLKTIKTKFREIKQAHSAQGVLSCEPGSSLFDELMDTLGENPLFILKEVAAIAIKEVNKEDARISFTDRQEDFSFYRDKWILLPQEQTVKVEFAHIEHMRFQADQVLKEHMKKMKAFIVHYDGLLMPIIRTMEEKGLMTAGDAIDLLSADA